MSNGSRPIYGNTVIANRRTRNIKVIFCWGTGCGLCEMMRGTWERLKKNNPRWKFDSVNVKIDTRYAENYGIDILPTFLVFRNNNFKGQIIGSRRLTKLQSETEALAVE